MRILLLGSGGREHALAWKIVQSQKLSELFIAPGNAGTNLLGINVDININDFKTIGEFAYQNYINMLIVGPEEPLVNGIHDYFSNDSRLKDILIVGPTQKGAMLEGSKEFAKAFMTKYNIPTARFLSVDETTIQQGFNFLQSIKPPFVLKADGLAAGKGVVILDDINEAYEELKSMLGGKFGKASKKVVIEEFMKGIELSVFVATDGENYKILPEAKDYKRIGNGDTGPNTGGMGAISPVPFATNEFMQKVETRIIKPTLEGLNNEQIKYQGFIFFGLINLEGEPYVIEYNVRMGDPETEVVIPRMKCDIIEVLKGIATGTLNKVPIEIEDQVATTIMLVSGGYPGNYEKRKEIHNLDKIDCTRQLVFHAGTIKTGTKTLTNGGRVIAVTSLNKTMKGALENSLQGAELIAFDGKYFRNDIGFDLQSI